MIDRLSRTTSTRFCISDAVKVNTSYILNMSGS